VELRYEVVVTWEVDGGGRVFGGGEVLPLATGPVSVTAEVGRGSQSSQGGRAGSSAIVVGCSEVGFDSGGLLNAGKGRGPVGKGHGVVTVSGRVLGGVV
jgi:hypothetical protein